MKMKRSYLYICLLLAAFAIGACRKDNLFKGTDNDIASFQLTQGSNVLKAYILNDSIVVTAPGNLSLTGAKAVLILSERATISPDPSTITDWTKTQQFVVTAYDGAKRTFTYVLQRNIISKDGDILLMTQADVDTLAKMGLTQINGSLTIGRSGGPDSITSLAGLTSLKTITSDLIINANYIGKDLTGLDNLTSVGSLQIGPDISTFTQGSLTLKNLSLPNLTGIIGNMTINCPAITSLQMPALTNVGLGMEIVYLDSLTTMEFPKLQGVAQTINITGYFLTNSLQSISFPALATVGGDFTISSWTNLTTVSLPLLTKAGGAILFGGEVALTSITAPKLQRISGNADFSSNFDMTTLDLSALTNVEGSFTIDGSISLADLNGLKALTTIGTDFDLSGLSALTDLSGLKALQSVGGNFTLQGLDQLVDANLQGLSGLKTIGGDVSILDVPFQNFNGWGVTKMNSLSIYASALAPSQIDISNITIATTLTINGIMGGGTVVKGANAFNAAVNIQNSDVTLTGFQKVKGLSYTWSTTPGSSLTLSLPNLQEVDGDCSFSTGTDITSVKNLLCPALTTVTGMLSITGQDSFDPNSAMTDLNGFSALKNAQSVTIAYNSALVDFTGMKNVIPALSAGSWQVSGNAYNPGYQDMVNAHYVQ